MLSIYVFEATNQCGKFACCLPVGEYLDTTLCLCNLTGHPCVGARVTLAMLSIRDGTSESLERLVRLTSGFRTRPARGPADAPGTYAGRSRNQHPQETSQHTAQTRGTPAAPIDVGSPRGRSETGDAGEARRPLANGRRQGTGEGDSGEARDAPLVAPYNHAEVDDSQSHACEAGGVEVGRVAERREDAGEAHSLEEDDGCCEA